MAKIILFSPPARKYSSSFKEITFPIGLVSIGTILERAGHQVKIVDCIAKGFENEEISEDNEGKTLIKYGLPDKQIKEEIEGFTPDIVGVSDNFTQQYKEALDILKSCKEINPNIATVLGGKHVSVIGKKILEKHQFVDFLIKGEGETPMKQLANHAKIGKRGLEDIPGLIFRDESSLIRENMQISHENLNEIPLPSLELLDLSLYDKRSHFFEVGGTEKEKWYPITFTRGCLYNCDFCQSVTLEGHKIRSFNLNKINQFLDNLKGKGIEDLIIEDDNFLRNKDFFGITQLLKEKGIKYRLANGIDPTIIDSKIIKELNRTGCYHLFYPLESGVPRILSSHKYSPLNTDRYSKILQKNKEHIKEITDNGIEVITGYMVGFPNESTDEIKRTGDYAKEVFELNPSMISTFVSCVTPFPGTKLHSFCKENNLIRYDWEEFPEMYDLTKAKIGPDIETLAKIEEERTSILSNANPEKYKDYLLGYKSWNSYKK